LKNQIGEIPYSWGNTKDKSTIRPKKKFTKPTCKSGFCILYHYANFFCLSVDSIFHFYFFKACCKKKIELSKTKFGHPAYLSRQRKLFTQIHSYQLDVDACIQMRPANGMLTHFKKRFMKKMFFTAVIGSALFASCSKDSAAPTPTPLDPNTAAKVMVDRFSATAGHLMVRSATNGLPAANAAVNFDAAPFITKGRGPAGQMVSYYNFDVQDVVPDEIFVFFKAGATTPVAGQLNIINTLPGETGYNDFWNVTKVTVPDNYVANTVTSEAGINAAGYTKTATNIIVNCPVVPEGSTASMRMGGGATGLTRGWYKDKVVSYFEFGEKALATTAAGKVMTSPIYVMFNVNPDVAGGGPPSGFKTETGNDKTHNVLATLPADAGYSPLWSVQILDNASFASVMNLATASVLTPKAANAANVNCPVASVQ
jgi:hypothetical protein